MGGSQSYQLTYFNAKGRAEVIRWLFAIAGQPYEDKRIEMDKWPAIKSTMPFGAIPILIVTQGSSTFTLSQSLTIGKLIRQIEHAVLSSLI